MKLFLFITCLINILSIINGRFQDLVDQMWAADEDRAKPGDIVLNWGVRVNSSSTNVSFLFSTVNEALFNRPVYAKLLNISKQNLFQKSVCEDDSVITGSEKYIILDDYLQTLTNTTVFQLAYEYLVKENATTLSNFTEFYHQLFQMWYGTYSRCKSKTNLSQGSSGFEHVFLGEWVVSSDVLTVGGQHNWALYYLQQKSGQIIYQGYINHEDDLIGTWRYSWGGYLKPTGGFFIGTSPAFDFAIFTTCFLTQQGNSMCQFNLDNKYNISITSFNMTCGYGGTCIGTTYPSGEMLPSQSSSTRFSVLYLFGLIFIWYFLWNDLNVWVNYWVDSKQHNNGF